MPEPTAPANPTAPVSPTSEPAPLDQNLFPHVIGEGVDNSAPGPTAPASTITPEQFAQLQSSFDTLRQETQAREARLTDTIQSLMMRPPTMTAAPQAPAAPQAFTLDDLPDPVQNPKAYNEQLQTRIAQYVGTTAASQSQAVVQQISGAAAINGLYNRLQNDHPELAKRSILLQGAAAAAFNELRAQGYDPVQAIQANPDGVLNAIVTRMQAEVGTAPNGAAPTAPTAPSHARSADIAGGSAPGASAPSHAPQPPSFITQMKSKMAEDGLI